MKTGRRHAALGPPASRRRDSPARGQRSQVGFSPRWCPSEAWETVMKASIEGCRPEGPACSAIHAEVRP